MLFSLGNQETLYYNKNNLCLLRDNSKAGICKIAKLTKLMTAKIHLVIRSYSGVRHSSSPSERWCPARAGGGGGNGPPPPTPHIFWNLAITFLQTDATIATYAWLNGQLEGWMDQLHSIHFPAALPVHISVSSAGCIKMPEKFVAMFRVRGWDQC